MWTIAFYALLGVLSVSTTVMTLLYFCYPSLLIRLGYKLYRSSCGMQVKFIGNADTVFCYGEKGKESKDKSSILFIHGYTGSKDHWVQAFKMLGNNHHLVAIDLPGHGASSTPPAEQELTIEYALESIKLFAEMVGLTDRPFHIVGGSLGGCLAGMFAATYPHLVERVTLVCPAMKTPEPSEFMKQVERAVEIGAENVQIHHCSLLPQTTQELQLMVESCVYADLKLSSQILKGVVQLRTPKNEFYLRVFRNLATLENLTILENNCHRIIMPSQVIWGEHDQILHKSGAYLLSKKLPNCQDVTILERCGHSFDLDRPGAFVKALLKFREANQ
ncbi:monoacylglycerol lipase ABHD6-like [Pomacea canaliculata]|uniref:monoacylglycerol lipase ABHD6-like n=1 Tax=Pomacea canaliculata TaxID=400727 RepID=UPI000D73CC95|nr:monoacylglycerol lipase ABHD6-like [Pomacea canaliculata]